MITKRAGFPRIGNFVAIFSKDWKNPRVNDSRQDFSRWYKEHRRRLSANGRGLDGGEPGRQDPAEFNRARKKILICRLSTYDDVRASISHRMLYWAARQAPDVYVDLAFFPTARDAAVLKDQGIPLWLASGCKMPPTAFDLIAVSISVPQEAFNLPAALRDSGLRLNHEDRMADPAHPLILLGGQAAGSVPFVHDLVDVVCLGDGILWLQEILKRFGPAKHDFLRALATDVEGAYVPSRYRHEYNDGVLTKIVPTSANTPFPVRHRVDPPASWIDGYDGAYIPFSDEDTEETLPLAFGCAYRCRFCQTGWLRKGLDASDRDRLREAARRLKTAMAACDLNLLASDACSVPELADIVADLRRFFPRVSVKSLAVSSLARDRSALDLIEKREFTFGMEGISARLRAYLGKPVDAESLLRIVRDLGPARLRQVKIFFIATGLETDDDMDELDQLLRHLRAAAPGCRWITSFMPLFHAPFTPLQFDELHTLSPDLCRWLANVVNHAGMEFRWSASPDEIQLMNLMCRAGRAAAPILAKLSLENGIRYYDGLPPTALPEAQPMFPPDLIKARHESDILPWDDMVAGASRSALWKSFRKAKHDSGEFFVQREGGRPLPARTNVFKANDPSAGFWIQLSEADAFHPEPTIARGMLRKLFLENPDAAESYSGHPQIRHPPGTSGIALLTAQFNTTIPFADGPATPVDLVFLVEVDAAFVRKKLEELRTGKVPFQTERHGNDRWSVIKKGYRNKIGLWALCEYELAESGLLLCNATTRFSEKDARVTAVFEKNGATLRRLKSTTAIQIPEAVVKSE